MEISVKDRFMSAAAYLFGIPALYIVLTESRRKQFLGYHGTQAFYLWLAFFFIFFAIRLLINLIWSSNYLPWLNIVETLALFIMGGYALYCAYRSLAGQTFRIPQ